MALRDKYESALIKAKADWRRTCDDPKASATDRRDALYTWRRARGDRDRARIKWRLLQEERRRTAADRRARGERRGAEAGEGPRGRREDRRVPMVDRRRTAR